jgi:hypothetical protein
MLLASLRASCSGRTTSPLRHRAAEGIWAAIGCRSQEQHGRLYFLLIANTDVFVILSARPSLGTKMIKFSFLVSISFVVLATPANAQCYGRDNVILETRRVCGHPSPDPCKLAEAKIAVDWVLYQDKGALQTARSEISQCKYWNNLTSVYIAILRAQMHNKHAWCNLHACYREVAGAGAMIGYLSELDTVGRIPDFW